MRQIEFNITYPKKINDIFSISQDKSEWKNKTKYIKKIDILTSPETILK